MKATLAGIELVLWRDDDDFVPPSLAAVRQAIEAEGFSGDRAPEIPITTAFRRAVKSQETDVLRASVGGKKRLIGQLDRITEEEDRLTRERQCGWMCDKETGEVSGPTIPMAECLVTYQLADVSRALKNIMAKDGAGSYSLRKSGGVYAVPCAAVDFLDRLERVADSLNLLMLRYEIPDNTKQRRKVSEAIAHDLVAELETHSAALAGYSDETRPAIVRNRAESIASSGTLIERLAPYLTAADYGLLDAQLTDLESVVQLAIDALANRPQQSRVLASE